MKIFHLLLITPSGNKEINLYADEYYSEDGSLVFETSDGEIVAVYPAGLTAIQSIEENEI